MDFDLVKRVKPRCVINVAVLLADLHLTIVVKLTGEINVVRLLNSKIIARA